MHSSQMTVNFAKMTVYLRMVLRGYAADSPVSELDVELSRRRRHVQYPMSVSRFCVAGALRSTTH